MMTAIILPLGTAGIANVLMKERILKINKSVVDSHIQEITKIVPGNV